MGTYSWEKLSPKSSPHRLFATLGNPISCLTFEHILECRYRLYRRLHFDHNQEVWEAYDQEKNQKVLCTIVRCSVKNRFPKELTPRRFTDAGTLVADQPPGLLNVFEEGFLRTQGAFTGYRHKISGLCYIITDIAPVAVPLSQIAKHRRLNLAEAVTILYEVARMLACLHERDWIHGQIAPQNLWVGHEEDEQPSVYLNGFSLIDQAEDLKSSVFALLHKTSDNSPASYLAPECIDEPPTPLSDQFLLGLSVYLLVSGRNPLSGMAPNAIRKRLSKTPLPLLHQLNSSIPVWFSEILARMLRAEPEQRFAGLRDMITELAQQIKNLPLDEDDAYVEEPNVYTEDADDEISIPDEEEFEDLIIDEETCELEIGEDGEIIEEGEDIIWEEPEDKPQKIPVKQEKQKSAPVDEEIIEEEIFEEEIITVNEPPKATHPKNLKLKIISLRKRQPKLKASQGHQSKLKLLQRNQSKLKLSQRNQSKSRSSKKNQSKLKLSQKNQPKLNLSQRNQPKLKLSQKNQPKLKLSQINQSKSRSSKKNQPNLKLLKPNQMRAKLLMMRAKLLMRMKNSETKTLKISSLANLKSNDDLSVYPPALVQV